MTEPRNMLRDMGLLPMRSTACRHRGEVVDLADCRACRGRVKVKVYQCGIYGRCTIDRPAIATACRTCRDRLDPAAENGA